jgi:hypothetical protein
MQNRSSSSGGNGLGNGPGNPLKESPHERNVSGATAVNDDPLVHHQIPAVNHNPHVHHQIPAVNHDPIIHH